MTTTTFQTNKDLPWQDWLEYITTFDKPGKQGLVGLMKSKKDDAVYVFKISQYINYLVQHELTVMRGLNDISIYCPHFCKALGSIICKVDPRTRKSGNPFEIQLGTSAYPIEKEVLLCEYIDKSTKLYNYIRGIDKIPEEVLYSTIKQVMMAIIIAQRQKRFSHYDLHSNNVMMRKCNKDLVFLYVLDEENQFCVPTLGHYPVIIDFGFSYIEDMDDGPLWPSMAHTDVGFMCDRFDWVADPKLFLVSVSDEIKDKRDSSQGRKLRRVVRNIFHPLKIDWGAGWDEGEKKGASDYITQMLRGYSKVSKIFDDFEHYCIDIIQTLVIMPIEKQDYSKIHVAYVAFLKEWLMIENQIESPFYNLYILKGIVDSARFVRAAYSDLATSAEAVATFRGQVLKRLDSVSKFCNIKKLHFEKMLCSLLVLSRSIEGILHDVIESRMAEKQKEYDRLPLQSPEAIYGALDANITDPYVYTNKTSICIVNSHTKETTLYKIPVEYLDTVNKMNTITRGTFVYDLYKS